VRYRAEFARIAHYGSFVDARKAESLSLDGTRILVVEDDVPNLRLLITLLEQEGYEVYGATDRSQAISLCEDSPFHLVLTDSFSRTPDSVLTSTTAIRNAAGNAPVILLTAHRVDSKDVSSAGFAAHIGKPFDIDELIMQVREVLISPPHC
jgi:CheY-like chemotaxis protein